MKWHWFKLILLLTTSDTDLSYSLGTVPVDLDVFIYVVQWWFWFLSSAHAHATNISFISRLPLTYAWLCSCIRLYLVFLWRMPVYSEVPYDFPMVAWAHSLFIFLNWHAPIVLFHTTFSQCSSFVPINPLIWSNRLTVSLIQFMW